jgi:hypothetical protein
MQVFFAVEPISEWIMTQYVIRRPAKLVEIKFGATGLASTSLIGLPCR